MRRLYVKEVPTHNLHPKWELFFEGNTKRMRIGNIEPLTNILSKIHNESGSSVGIIEFQASGKETAASRIRWSNILHIFYEKPYFDKIRVTFCKEKSYQT